MTVISHNLMAMNAGRQFNIVTRKKTKSNERLSSGYRINRAADDAAGLSISEKMRNQIRGLNQGAKNIEDGISFCNTAEGALQEVHNILGRMKELSVKAANDVNASEDRRAIDDEIQNLKEEISRISRTTEFNTKKIFQHKFAIEFSDDIQILQIFDANNGNPLSGDSYGGIILDGATRIPWKDIDPDMVYTDASTGETMFKAGTYAFSHGKYDLTFECKSGTKPPEITIEFKVFAEQNGLSVAGDSIPWSKVVNDDGECILDVEDINGYYHFDYGEGTGEFLVEDCANLQDVIDGLNNRNAQFSRRYLNVYDGYYKAQAVDVIDTGSEMRVNNTIATAIRNHTNIDADLQADADGIWVVDAAGNALADSKKTWAELGINSWDSMSDISDTKEYVYRYKKNDYDINFKFTLLDETSKESVIDGINNGGIVNKQVITNNKTSMDFTAGNAVLDGKVIRDNNKLSIYEEADLGRNFSLANADFAQENMTYDKNTNQFSLQFNNVISGLSVLEYKSVNLTNQKTIKDNAETYLSYLSARRVQQLVKGTSGISNDTLSDVLGSGMVTASNYLSETVSINKAVMETTSNISNGTYPCASIDFSGLGSQYDVFDLLGTGFNSTCKTCDNHYSVMFVYGNTKSTTSDGYGYTKSYDGQGNYTLQVDIQSFLKKGIQTGEAFTKALVNLLDDSNMDFHFTQYASQGAKLYICDNRPQNTGAPAAKFDTEPYAVDKAIIDVGLREKNGEKSLQLQYTYDIATGVTATADMEEDTNGDYVEDTVKGGYKLYVKSDYYGENGALLPPYTDAPKRYKVKVTNNISSWEDYYDKVMTGIAEQSKIKIASTDYDVIKYAADEGANLATVSKFEFQIEDKRDFWIQSGANAGDGLFLKWKPFSLYKLGLGKVNTLTHDAAEDLIGRADKATKQVSELRSKFGAYTNRLEYMYANNTNYSENLQKAESGIRDTDMAEEMMDYSKHNILEQIGQAMIAQANQQNGGVLSLLQ